MSDSRLKPCPFCGGQPYIPSRTDDEGYAVRCSRCDCESFGMTFEEAKFNWNRRASDPVKEKLVGLCRKLMDVVDFRYDPVELRDWWIKEITDQIQEVIQEEDLKAEQGDRKTDTTDPIISQRT